MTHSESDSLSLYNTTISHFIKQKAPIIYTPGFFSSDENKKIEDLQNEKIYLINTAKKLAKNGEHWVSFFKINDNFGYYFDPIGYAPCNKYWKIIFLSPTEIAKSGIRLIAPNKNYMDPYGTVCGEYSCVLAYHINELIKKGKESEILNYNHHPFEEFGIYPADHIHGVQKKNDQIIASVYKRLT